ncbi:hypothetical protein BST36_05520 [Mycolicibacterium moriokaense]|jgi:hypothetical protein|nr:hypothetical protein [Mycolicibacterium moriokaense]ORB26048.1 hypothetical protein BST36_05520 [Mycolicibacterium moriokaense]
MTAWVEHGHDGDFVHQRIADYVPTADSRNGLITGLVNLFGLLLMGMEVTTGRNAHEILQTIARTVSRHEHLPDSTRLEPGS